MNERSRPLAALLTDLVCVVAFCSIGRRSHAEGLTVTGVAETAWPFLAGTLAGWAAARAWQRPANLYPTGLIVWAFTVVIGMLLRKATSAGTAGSFIVVASVTTAALLLGWRAIAKVLARR
ncbi:MAG: DUF3054 domain-containing protein [Mycobacterium sp.]